MDLCTRYELPSRFQAPADIWTVPGKSARDIEGELLVSFSAFVLMVLGNIHNSIMSSTDTDKWTKVVVVILLDMAALAVYALAVAEAMVRLATGAIFLPCLPAEQKSTFVFLFKLGLLNAFQSFNALYAVWAFSTSNNTIDIRSSGDSITKCLSCGCL